MARFDCAQWRPIGANTGGRLSPNLGLILHHAVANGSLFSFFNSPSAGVSAHFWVAKDGRIEQYVDTDVVAWHGRQLNSRYVGVETEGCGPAPHAEPMTPQMLDAMVRLYAEGMRRHGWVNAQANKDGDRGLGYHRMAVATACPCDVRLNMRGEILRRQTGGGAPLPGAPSTQPPPATEEVEDMAIRDDQSGGTWVAARDGAVFAYDGAPYLGGTNQGNPPHSQGTPCVGITSDGAGGYVLIHDWAGRGGERFRRYRFRR